MINRFHAHVVAVCAVLLLLSMATAPVFAQLAPEPEPKQCREACMEAGAPNVEQCVADCEEFMVGAGRDEGALCWYYLVRDCGISTLEIKTLIYLIKDCIEDDFSKSCFTKALCDADDDCIKDICKCGQKKISKDECLRLWKKGKKKCDE